MALPQSKISKRRARCRKGANRYRGIQLVPCKNCGAQRLPHRVCPACGTYGGRQVVSVTTEQ